GGRGSPRLESQPLGGGLDAGELVVGAQVERAAVVAEAAVGGLVVGQDLAQQRAVGGEYEHAVDRGGEDVPFWSTFSPSGSPFSGCALTSAVASCITLPGPSVPSSFSGKAIQIAWSGSELAT